MQRLTVLWGSAFGVIEILQRFTACGAVHRLWGAAAVALDPFQQPSHCSQALIALGPFQQRTHSCVMYTHSAISPKVVAARLEWMEELVLFCLLLFNLSFLLVLFCLILFTLLPVFVLF